MRSLIVVDVQNDFCEEGALAVEGGNRVAADIADYLRENSGKYARIFFTQDWHNAPPDDNDGHFATGEAKPDFVDTWPIHCVEGTYGAWLHGDLEIWNAFAPETVQSKVTFIRKGQGMAAYSGFDGRFISPDNAGMISLSGFYRASRNANHDIDVCGLAFDYCVAATAFDAHRCTHGNVRVLTDLTASVARKSERKKATLLSEVGVELV